MKAPGYQKRKWGCHLLAFTLFKALNLSHRRTCPRTPIYKTDQSWYGLVKGRGSISQSPAHVVAPGYLWTLEGIKFKPKLPQMPLTFQCIWTDKTATVSQKENRATVFKTEGKRRMEGEQGAQGSKEALRTCCISLASPPPIPGPQGNSGSTHGKLSSSIHQSFPFQSPLKLCPHYLF